VSQAFVRGQKSPLPSMTGRTDLYVGIRLVAAGTWDISCFGLDVEDKLSDDSYFIFYNQPRSPEGAVQKLGAQADDSESFRVILHDLPDSIGRLSFCAALDGPGSAAELESGYLRMVVGGDEIMRYSFTGADFGSERAIMVGDLYRKGLWRISAVGQGFSGGLAELIRSFGGEVDDDPVPSTAPPAPGSTPAAATPPDLSIVGSPPPPPPPLGFELLPSQAAPVPPGAVVSLQKYRESPTTGRWTQQNPRLVKVTLGPEMYARRGSMVAYQGEVEFLYKGAGGVRALLEGAATGQQLRLMTCRGQGEVFLAENAADLHVVELQGQALCVNARNVLAFDPSLQIQVQRIESAGIPGGGMFHLIVSGQGAVVVMTRGTPVTLPCDGPTFADMNAVVAWTAGMRVSVSSQVRVSRQIYAGASGESVALQFMGMQGHFVVVQPYEV
jgi:stress response protein SCP2/uncharacterized protein (AIM24 family)